MSSDDHWPVTIRPATLEDCERIAALHTRVWRATYREIAPAEVKRILTEEVRRERWRAILSAPVRGQVTLIAETGADAAGFALMAPATLPEFGDRHEVKYLYVDAAHQGRGIGRRLLAASARAAIADGASGLALGVLEGNDPAIAFYEHLGGRRIGRYTDPGPVWRSRNLIYAWDDPKLLL